MLTTREPGPLRVGLVCPYSVSAPGGVQQQVLGLARALRRLGCCVEVYAPGDPAAAPPGVTVVGRSFGFTVNGSTAPMAPQPAAARRVVRALRAAELDVVHLHEPFAPSITIPVLLARPAPLVGTFHAAGEGTVYRLAGPAPRRLAGRLAARLAVSADAMRLASRRLGGRYEVIANSIDLAERPPPRPAGRRASHSVLFLGRHEPRKGLVVLLDAARALPGVEIWVAGEGPTTAQLRKRTHPGAAVTWLGAVSESDKEELLRRASALCVPSLHGESFGVVLLEAMAAGTPIVAADLPAYRSVVRHGQEGLLAAPGDPAAFARGLRRVLNEPGLADRLRAGGLARVREFDATALARRHLAVYQRVVAGGATARSRRGR